MTRMISISTAFLAMLICTTTLAATKTEKRMDNSLEVFKTFTEIPEQAIPSRILRDAYGIAILPGVIKVGFTLGARFGKGVLIVRQDDGSWSNPAFVAFGGGSMGLQIGAQSTDIVLIFRDQRSIANIYNGKLTLGGDVSAAAGPVGRSTSASTDERLGAEIYSYSRSRGLFAGVSLDGSWLGMDKKSNQAYYGNGMSPEQILAANNMPVPLLANQLTDLIAASAPRLGHTSTQPTRAAMAQPMAESTAEVVEVVEVKAYALEPIVLDENTVIDSTGDETTF